MSNPLWINEMFSSIQGEGYLAGRRQIFIRLEKCNLDCAYCDTDFRRSDVCKIEESPGSAKIIQIKQPQTVENIAAIALSWCQDLPAAHHSFSITGGEPLLHADILQYWLPKLRKIIPIHLETNGSLVDSLTAVIKHIDYISMDMKLPSTAACSLDLWDLHHSFLEVAAKVTSSVKLVIGELTTEDEIIKACKIVLGVDKNIALFLQPVTSKSGMVTMSAVKILQLQAAASSILPDVRVIPQMHVMLGAL